MTDYEAIKWLINNFKDIPKDFSNPTRWEALEKAIQRYRTVFPNSPYTEVLEEYHRALYTVATVDYIIKKGGLPDV